MEKDKDKEKAKEEKIKKLIEEKLPEEIRRKIEEEKKIDNSELDEVSVSNDMDSFEVIDGKIVRKED